MADAMNCPNCGAPIRGAVCEYCGTSFELKTSKKSKKAVEDFIRYKMTLDHLLNYGTLSVKEYLERCNV